MLVQAQCLSEKVWLKFLSREFDDVRMRLKEFQLVPVDIRFAVHCDVGDPVFAFPLKSEDVKRMLRKIVKSLHPG
jgi:hypothetical protein